MKNMNYLEILQEAACIVWEKKFLWFFGFLVFLGSIASNINVDSNSFFRKALKTELSTGFIGDNQTVILLLSFAAILIIVFLLIVRIMASIAIIKAVNNIELYKQLSPISILKEAKYYLWRTVLLEMVVTFFLLLVMLIIAVPVLYLFSLKNSILAISALIVAIAIVSPLVILAFYLIRYANMFIVLLDGGIKPSLELAYATFQKNLKNSLLMGLVMMGASLGLVFILMILLLLLAIIFVPIGFLAFWLFAKIGAITISIASGSIFVVVMTVIVSMYYAFLHTAWLLFFKKISMEKDKEDVIIQKLELEALDVESI